MLLNTFAFNKKTGARSNPCLADFHFPDHSRNTTLYAQQSSQTPNIDGRLDSGRHRPRKRAKLTRERHFPAAGSQSVHTEFCASRTGGVDVGGQMVQTNIQCTDDTRRRRRRRRRRHFGTHYSMRNGHGGISRPRCVPAVSASKTVQMQMPAGVLVVLFAQRRLPSNCSRKGWAPPSNRMRGYAPSRADRVVIRLAQLDIAKGVRFE